MWSRLLIVFIVSFCLCESRHGCKVSSQSRFMSRKLLSTSRQSQSFTPPVDTKSSHEPLSTESNLSVHGNVLSALLFSFLASPAYASVVSAAQESIPSDSTLPDANALASFVPPEVGTEIYVGSFVSMIPIVWATFEFNSRIQTQRQCLLCTGSGLVKVTRSGTPLTRPRKCWSCGGFLPWLGWKYFFFSTFFDVGNGGVLQRPAADYDKIQRDVLSGAISGNPVAGTSGDEEDQKEKETQNESLS